MQNENKEMMEKLVQDHYETDAHGRRNLYSIYKTREALDALADYLAAPFEGKVDYVVSPEANGFILGTLIAERLGVGFIPIRNSGLAALGEENCYRASYIDHRDLARTLQIRKKDLPEKAHILLVDDWIGTAATSQACITIIEEASGTVEGIAAFGADYSAATAKQLDNGFIRCAWCRKGN